MSSRKETKLLFESWRSYVKQPLNEAKIPPEVMANPSAFKIKYFDDEGDDAESVGKAIASDPDLGRYIALANGDQVTADNFVEAEPVGQQAAVPSKKTPAAKKQKAPAATAPTLKTKTGGETAHSEVEKSTADINLVWRGRLFAKEQTLGINNTMVTSVLYGFLLPFANKRTRAFLEQARAASLDESVAKVLKPGDFIISMQSSMGKVSQKTANKDEKGKTRSYQEPGLDKHAVAVYAGLELSQDEFNPDGSLKILGKADYSSDSEDGGTTYRELQLEAFDNALTWLWKNMYNADVQPLSQYLSRVKGGMEKVLEARDKYLKPFFNVGKNVGRQVGDLTELALGKREQFIQQVRAAGITAAVIPDNHILVLTNKAETGISYSQFIQQLVEGYPEGARPLKPGTAIGLYASNTDIEGKFITLLGEDGPYSEMEFVVLPR